MNYIAPAPFSRGQLERERRGPRFRTQGEERVAKLLQLSPEKLFSRLDANGDGSISKKEFVRAIKKMQGGKGESLKKEKKERKKEKKEKR